MPMAARILDMHVCPMVTAIVPHVGGRSAWAVPTVLIGFMPAARVGDMAVCVGPPDVIALGSFTVLIGGMPAARMGDLTAHGGTIVLGIPDGQYWVRNLASPRVGPARARRSVAGAGIYSGFVPQRDRELTSLLRDKRVRCGVPEKNVRSARINSAKSPNGQTNFVDFCAGASHSTILPNRRTLQFSCSGPFPKVRHAYTSMYGISSARGFAGKSMRVTFRAIAGPMVGKEFLLRPGQLDASRQDRLGRRGLPRRRAHVEHSLRGGNGPQEVLYQGS